ncbi:aldo/keto reductase [Phytohabitans suffuscus]|uniref:Oxidoreductase n=1 Tax=Phytohabitans suffuscus TaxID=624315 RepID=A0A6F8YR61_9ACTN|nr:aldo/keto reductase [Phytohabitans suffuscus]BCB88546.1 oxidoreductase [Phytohabitans suffuscus]
MTKALHTPLGRTGLRVSRLGLGTVNFGGRVEEHDALLLLDAAVDRGITLVDTANIYGWRVHKGYTEELIGRWFAGRPGRRDDIVLATKVGSAMTGRVNDSGLSARNIIAACEASLRRLGTDWIDLYQMHEVDRTVGWAEVWEAMETLIRQGKVRYVGSSNFAGWDIASAQDAAERRGLLGLASEQCCYNLVTRHTELEVIPAAAAHGLGVLVWSPLHSGLLGGVLRKVADGTAVKSAQGRAVPALERDRDTIAGYERYCAKIERDPAEVAMAWALSRPHVTSILTGPRTPSQLDAAFRALERGLHADELAALDEMFPPIGFGGPAPKAWIA